MRTGLVTLISLVAAFGLFAWEHGVEGTNLDEARAAVVNMIVMVQTCYLLNCRSRTRSYFPVLNRLIHTAPVRGEAWQALHRRHRRFHFRRYRAGKMAALPRARPAPFNRCELAIPTATENHLDKLVTRPDCHQALVLFAPGFFSRTG
jgi:hypothetical protein